MGLKLKDKAIDFTLKTSEGSSFSLFKILETKSVVIFFYPKSFTAGCTREACSFREDYSYFQQNGIELVGISHDSISVQSKFKSKFRLPYTLLSDPNKKISKSYGAIYPFGLLTKRITFYISKSGVIEAIYDNLFLPDNHLEEIKKKIELLKSKAIALPLEN